MSKESQPPMELSAENQPSAEMSRDGNLPDNSDTFITLVDSADESSSQDSVSASVDVSKDKEVEPGDVVTPQQYLTAIMQLGKIYNSQTAEMDSKLNSDIDSFNRSVNLSNSIPLSKDALSSDTVIATNFSEMRNAANLFNKHNNESMLSAKINDESSLTKGFPEIENKTFQTSTSMGGNIPLTVQDYSSMSSYNPNCEKPLCQQCNMHYNPMKDKIINEKVANKLKNYIKLKQKQLQKHMKVIENEPKMKQKQLQNGMEAVRNEPKIDWLSQQFYSKMNHSSSAKADEISSCYVEHAPMQHGLVHNESQFSHESHHVNKDILKQAAHTSDVIKSSSSLIPSHVICLNESSESREKSKSGEFKADNNSGDDHETDNILEDKNSDKYYMKHSYKPRNITKRKIDLTALNHLKTGLKSLVKSKNKTHGIDKEQESPRSIHLVGNTWSSPTVLDAECIDKAQPQLSHKSDNGLYFEEKSNKLCAAMPNDTILDKMQDTLESGELLSHMQSKKTNYNQETNQNTVCIDLNTSKNPHFGNESFGSTIGFSDQHNNILVTGNPPNIYIINVNNICNHDLNSSLKINDGSNIQKTVNVDSSEEDNSTDNTHGANQNIGCITKHNVSLNENKSAEQNNECKTKHNASFHENKQVESDLPNKQASDTISISDSDSEIEETQNMSPIIDDTSKHFSFKNVFEKEHNKLLKSRQNILRNVVKKRSETQLKLHECKKRPKCPSLKGNYTILKKLLASPTKTIQTDKFPTSKSSFGNETTTDAFRNSMSRVCLDELSKENTEKSCSPLQSNLKEKCKSNANEIPCRPTEVNKQNTAGMPNNETKSNAKVQNTKSTSMCEDLDDIEENKIPDLIEEEENGQCYLIELVTDSQEEENDASRNVPINIDANELEVPLSSMCDNSGNIHVETNGLIDIDENESDDLNDFVTENQTEENNESRNTSQSNPLFIEISDHENECDNEIFEKVSAYESSNTSDNEQDGNEFYEELDKACIFDDDFYDAEKEEVRRKRGKMCSATNSCYVILSRMNLVFGEDGTIEKGETNECDVGCRKRFLKSYVNCTY